MAGDRLGPGQAWGGSNKTSQSEKALSLSDLQQNKAYSWSQQSHSLQLLTCVIQTERYRVCNKSQAFKVLCGERSSSNQLKQEK